MKISELFEASPQLIKLHYFDSVDDTEFAQSIGMRQDRKGHWYLPQYNTSSGGFDQKMTSAIRMFKRPRTVELKP